MGTELVQQVSDVTVLESEATDNTPESGNLLLQAAAQRNEATAAQWSDMRRAIEHSVEQHIKNFQKDDTSLFDKAATPAWPMDNEAVEKVFSRLRHLLDQFVSEPPFTIQRIAELALSPEPHYASLPKYLRALERCLLVSSPSGAFPAPVPTLPNGRPARSRSSSNASTPLLSPIPFLVSRLNNAPGSPRVDELDLGEGTAEMEQGPVALTSTTAGTGVKSPPPVQESAEARLEDQRVADEMETDALAVEQSRMANVLDQRIPHST